jgi:hypothetical protein
MVLGFETTESGDSATKCGLVEVATTAQCVAGLLGQEKTEVKDQIV